MNKKRTILFTALGLTFALAAASVVVVEYMSSKTQKATAKSAYELYCETHPDYNKSEDEWLQDLVNGKLGDKEKYTVTFDSDGGTAVPSQTVLEGEKAIEPVAPTKSGYSFNEWTYNGNPWIFYGFAVTENITLKATWTMNVYSIIYNLNGGTIEAKNPSSYTVKSSFSLNNPSRVGYNFSGWFDSNNKKIEAITEGMTGNLFLTAQWSPLKYNLIVSSSSDTKGTVKIDSGEGYTNEEITISATPLENYCFKGWYVDDERISLDLQYTFIMPAHDFKIVAKFDEKRKVTLTVDESKGSISGSGEYIIGDPVTIKCEEKEGGIFKGWYSSDTLVSSFKEYSFEMPSTDYNLEARFVLDEEKAEYMRLVNNGMIPHFSEDLSSLTYGMYPKSVVSDLDVLVKLEALEDVVDGQYYEVDDISYVRRKVKIYDFTKAVDIDPTTVPTIFDDGSEMIAGEERWFKVEPITWDVVKGEDNSFTLISRELVDNGQFHTSSQTRKIDDKTIYANNYEYSYVREWLGNGFYNTAFKLNSECIIDTNVDNSDISTGVPKNYYACDDTIDKIFLPSVKEINELPENINKICKTSDYVRASGVFYDCDDYNMFCSDYWTRSPDGDRAYRDLMTRYTSKGWYGRCSSSLSHCYRVCITLNYK